MVVSGTAKGGDLLGERYAIENKYSIKRFKPDWSIGKRAGILRNIDMAKYTDIVVVVAYWDGKSKGTKQMIEYCKSIGKEVYIINF